MIAKEITIQIPEGLEVSPIAKLVQIANQYESKVYVKSDNKHINAKSIMGMMSLALRTGDKMTVSAEGSDEDQAVEGLEKYLCNI